MQKGDTGMMMYTFSSPCLPVAQCLNLQSIVRSKVALATQHLQYPGSAVFAIRTTTYFFLNLRGEILDRCHCSSVSSLFIGRSRLMEDG